ncbi:MAG: hypothetical protein JWN49_208 [Parcubacteria group bacterium]|nr:hypothetical protein [Parcubacteria group bacterium]
MKGKEGIEAPKLPEIDRKEALSAVQELKMEEGEEFSYNGTDFYLIFISAKEMANSEDQSVGSFYASTLIAGFDIYLYEGLSEADKRRVLFHEIIEANLMNRYSVNSKLAHETALKLEEEEFGPRDPNATY